MNTKCGDILFVSGNDWLSKIIKFITNSEFSHVVIALDDRNIIEVINGIYIRQVEYRIPYEVVDIGFHPDKYDLLKKAQPYFKDGYDYIYLFTLGLKYLTKKLFPSIDIDHRYTCVEFACEILRQYGYDIEAESPQELYDKLKLYKEGGKCLPQLK